MLQIHLHSNSHVPIFQQMVEQVVEAVKLGKLHEGDQLPSERELAQTLGVARGTVKKAYEELVKRGVIEVRKGKGTFVKKPGSTTISDNRSNSLENQRKITGRVEAGEKPLELGRKKQALNLLSHTLEALEQMRFTPREIEALFHLSLMERLEKRETFYIAAVDCNIESLQMFRQQVAYLKGIDLKEFLLSEVLHAPDAEKMLSPFRLILVTSTHYEDLLEAIPNLKNQILQVIVSPSPETILEIGGIRSTDRVGIFCESQTFSEIIQNKLKGLRIHPAELTTLLYQRESREAGDREAGEREIGAFLQKVDVLIIPPGYSFPISRENKAILQRFREEGGKIIPFEYRIERGSLLYLEERIQELWHAY
ncbi:MAG: GntR family transcriptional regulator [Spirochaetales bacterium]